MQREALSRVKAFAEAWATEMPNTLVMVFRSEGREQLLREDLNRIIALAEDSLATQENPPRGGH